MACRGAWLRLGGALRVYRGGRPFVTSAITSLSTSKVALWGALSGAVVGGVYSGYSYLDFKKPETTDYHESDPDEFLLGELPAVTPTSRVVGAFAPELHIVLFQYQTCPFCNKVRAYLDAQGFSYDVIEVDALMRRALKWSKYKKVPVALVSTENGYRQLNDSTAIISTLSSYVASRHRGVDDIARLYPTVTYVDENGKRTSDVLNKYFLMYDPAPPAATIERQKKERQWRKWADDELVHVVSPNVYRTLDEARDTFEWFASAGGWRVHFPAWEVTLMINVGAFAMWLIGKRLKKKHNLTDDVRVSLYNDCNRWTKAIRDNGRGQFMGGESPDLADLAVFGVLSSMEGCEAFQDVLRNTKIKGWFYGVKEYVARNRGTVHDGLAEVVA